MTALKYKNPIMKKVKKTLPMQVSCGRCKEAVILYQKKGKGGLLRLYLERVVESEMPLTEHDLVCPYCQTVMGHRIEAKNKICYKMRRGLYNTNWL